MVLSWKYWKNKEKREASRWDERKHAKLNLEKKKNIRRKLKIDKQKTRKQGTKKDMENISSPFIHKPSAVMNYTNSSILHHVLVQNMSAAALHQNAAAFLTSTTANVPSSSSPQFVDPCSHTPNHTSLLSSSPSSAYSHVDLALLKQFVRELKIPCYAVSIPIIGEIHFYRKPDRALGNFEVSKLHEICKSTN